MLPPTLKYRYTIPSIVRPKKPSQRAHSSVLQGAPCILAPLRASNILDSSPIPSFHSAYCVLLTSLLFHYVSLLPMIELSG